MYIDATGYYTSCGKIYDDKILCGCARECDNLQVDESELTAGGECPAYKGTVFVQTCDATYTNATLAPGAETELSEAMETLASVIADTAGGATLSEDVRNTLATARATITEYRTDLKTKAALVVQALVFLLLSGVDLVDSHICCCCFAGARPGRHLRELCPR